MHSLVENYGLNDFVALKFDDQIIKKKMSRHIIPFFNLTNTELVQVSKQRLITCNERIGSHYHSRGILTSYSVRLGRTDDDILRYVKAIVKYSYVPHGPHVTPRDISRLTNEVCVRATNDLREQRCLEKPPYCVIPDVSGNQSKDQLSQNTRWRCATPLD